MALIPEGWLKIAHRFNGGKEDRWKSRVPSRTTEADVQSGATRQDSLSRSRSCSRFPANEYTFEGTSAGGSGLDREVAHGDREGHRRSGTIGGPAAGGPAGQWACPA